MHSNCFYDTFFSRHKALDKYNICAKNQYPPTLHCEDTATWTTSLHRQPRTKLLGQFHLFSNFCALLLSPPKEEVTPLPTLPHSPFSACLIMAILILSYARLIDILDSATRILQCWLYYLKINFEGHKHDTEVAIAIDSCFPIIVARQLARRNNEIKLR